MTDLLITQAGDAWIHSGRTGLNTGSGAWVQVKSGERLGFVWPPLQALAGRTVLAASLVGRVGPGHVAQTYTVAPVTKRWSPGRVKWGTTGGPTVNLAAAVTETVAALPDKGVVEFDVTSMVAAVSAGTDWFGVRISTNSTAAGQKFYATDSGAPSWELRVTLSDAPEQPSNLRPNAGAVSSATPILAWDFTDLGGDSTEQAEFRVQIDTPAVDAEPDEVAPDFDTGWTVGADPQFDVAASGHTPATTDTLPTYWRVQTKDGAGEASEWSDWADYTVSALLTVVVDSPVGPFGDPSPTLAAHTLEGVDVWWKAWVTGPDRSDIRAESGLQTSSIAWEIPERNSDRRRVLREDEAGWIHLQVGDYVDRAVAVGEKPYVDVWIAVEFDDDLGIQPPTYLDVVQPDEGDPRMRWTWARSEAASAWLLQVDDVTVARLDADEVTATGSGYYTYTDNGLISPMRPHTLQVRALEGESRSVKASPSVRFSYQVAGVWLVPDDGEPIVLDGTAVGDFGRSDRAATFTPLVGPEVDVVYDYEGMKGSFVGSIDDRDDDVWDKLARIEALAESTNRVVRMVWGSHSITARIMDLSAVAADDIMPSNPRHNVRFRFVQVGD